MMFAGQSPKPGWNVVCSGHADAMADLFAIVGVVTVSLLGVARWWEEHR
jgi:hypothetical protein